MSSNMGRSDWRVTAFEFGYNLSQALAARSLCKFDSEFYRLPLFTSSFSGRFVSLRNLSTFAALALTVTLCPSANARTVSRHRYPRLHAVRHMLLNVALPGAGLIPDTDDEMPEEGKQYELKLAREGGEALDVVYRIGNTYVPEALDKLSSFLHDSHNAEVKNYDPRTFDVLHTMLAKLNHSGSVIQVLSGYRSQETNDALRASGTTNAAEHSQHIEGTALDLRVQGVPAVQLRDAALSVGGGGVGYYPSGQFVHVDTGPVREWSYAPHHGGRRARGGKHLASSRHTGGTRRSGRRRRA